jgi:DnaA family protein
LVDEVERLDPERQHAAFALFVEATARGAQMACAGRLPPVDLAARDDLRTRLGWGLVFRIQPLPDIALRRALTQAAAHNGLQLSDEVLDFLLARFTRELGSLMALLDRLDRYALAQVRAITIPLIKQMLAEEALPG